MSSPFLHQSNGLLTIAVATGGYTEDPATGNPIERTQEQQLKVMISRPSTRNAVAEIPGPDQEIVRLTGRATDPAYLPSWVKTGAIGTLAIVDLAAGSEEVGRFTFTSVQQSQFKQVTRALGSYFEGNFQVDRPGEISHEN